MAVASGELGLHHETLHGRETFFQRSSAQVILTDAHQALQQHGYNPELILSPEKAMGQISFTGQTTNKS